MMKCQIQLFILPKDTFTEKATPLWECPAHACICPLMANGTNSALELTLLQLFELLNENRRERVTSMGRGEAEPISQFTEAEKV